MPFTMPMVGAAIVAATLYNLFVSARPAEPGPLEIALNVALVAAMALTTAIPHWRVAWWIGQVTSLFFICGSTLINLSIDGAPARALLWMPWLAVVYVQNASGFAPRTGLAVSLAVFVTSLGVMAPYWISGKIAPGQPVFDALIVMTLFHLTLILMLFNVTRRGAFEITWRVRAEAALDLVEMQARTEAELSAARLKLAQLDRSLAASALAETIAHEIKQPLTSISAGANAALNWLQRNPPAVAEAQACAQRILSDAGRASEIVVSTRDLIHRQRGARAPVDVGILIGDVVTILRDDAALRGITLTAKAADGLPQLQADIGQLRQLVVNLTMNAIEASRASSTDMPSVAISADGTEHFIVISVEDRGRGFQPGGTERAFEPFYTTKSDGMGLGLAICRIIAEAHDGVIEIQALPRGTCVSVTFPVAAD